jgi:hypothetical protein
MEIMICENTKEFISRAAVPGMALSKFVATPAHPKYLVGKISSWSQERSTAIKSVVQIGGRVCPCCMTDQA